MRKMMLTLAASALQGGADYTDNPMGRMPAPGYRAEYSSSLTKLVGVADSRHSGYLDPGILDVAPAFVGTNANEAARASGPTANSSAEKRLASPSTKRFDRIRLRSSTL